MTLSFRTVKKEIRILGLDTCQRGWAYGAVVRGGLFLDGVVCFSLTAKDLSKTLAGGIQATKYYPELRVIMLHDPASVVTPARLETLALLPVLEVAKETKGKGKMNVVYHSRRGRLWYHTNLPSKTAENILSLAWVTGGLPEPARVAHLLARALPSPLLDH